MQDDSIADFGSPGAGPEMDLPFFVSQEIIEFPPLLAQFTLLNRLTASRPASV